MIKNLISFYNRRIYIPVDKNSLVLDIGSGDKPHWRADVLVDKYLDDKYGFERSGSKSVVKDRPIFNTDATNLPFKDKVFDYIICSHLLEHVSDPGKVIEEMIRVGKAGYIELPYEGSSKIWDFPSHLWYCRLEGNKIIFTAKENQYFDKEINNYIKKDNNEKYIKKLFGRNFKNCIIQIVWKGEIDYKIIGKPNLELLEGLDNDEVEYNNIFYLIRSFFYFLVTSLFFSRIRYGELNLKNILKS